ncbi:MAG: PEP-CTERM sorting domain-containing protein [Thermodesulfobacteriota bacterium]
MRKLLPLIALLLVLAPWAAAQADTIQPLELGFSRITSNSPYGDQVDVLMSISQLDSDSLLFRFTNQSSLSSVVSEIYFQDSDSLVSSLQIRNDLSVGKVYFTYGASPSDLPSGGSVNFSTSFAVEAKSPAPKWGISPGESLSLILNLTSSAAVNALVMGLSDQSFAVGLHITSIAGSQSDSFVNTPPPGSGVPEPGTMALMGSALLSGLGLRRKQIVQKLRALLKKT